MSMTSRQVCTEPLINLYKHEVKRIFDESYKLARQVSDHHHKEYTGGCLTFNKKVYNPFLVVALPDVTNNVIPDFYHFWDMFKEAEFKEEIPIPEHLFPRVKELADRIHELDTEIPMVKQYFLNAFNRSINIHVIKKLLCEAACNLITTHHFESPDDWDNAQAFPQEVITEFHEFNRPYELMVRNRILRNMLINPN